MTQRSSSFARCGSCSSVGGQHRSSSTVRGCSTSRSSCSRSGSSLSISYRRYSLSRSHGRFQNPSRRGGNARSPSAGLLCPRRLVAEPAVGERGVIPRNHGRGAPGRNLDAQPTAVRHVAVPVSRVTLAVIAWSEMSEANSRPTLSTSFVAATASASVSVTSIDS